MNSTKWIDNCFFAFFIQWLFNELYEILSCYWLPISSLGLIYVFWATHPNLPKEFHSTFKGLIYSKIHRLEFWCAIGWEKNVLVLSSLNFLWLFLQLSNKIKVLFLSSGVVYIFQTWCYWVLVRCWISFRFSSDASWFWFWFWLWLWSWDLSYELFGLIFWLIFMIIMLGFMFRFIFMCMFMFGLLNLLFPRLDSLLSSCRGKFLVGNCCRIEKLLLLLILLM